MPRRVALISRDGREEWGIELPAAAVEPGSEVAPLRFDGDVDELHLDLLRLGGVDDVVDVAAQGKAAARLWCLAYHVATRATGDRPGTLAVLLPRTGGPHEKARGALLDAVARTQELMVTGPEPPVITRTDTRPRPEQDVHALAATLERLEVDGDWVLARVRPRTLAKVPERHVNALLEARPELGRLLDVVPAAEAGPALSLREWHHPVCLPEQVAYSGGIVLPCTFRDPSKKRLRIRSIVDWGERASLHPAHEEPEELPGTWFHLDNVLRGHFGHALTEQLSLTWAWDRAQAAHPGVRALVFETDRLRFAGWERELWAAAGIEHVEVRRRPARVERLLTATPAYAIGAYVHPALVPVWDDFGAALAARGTADLPTGRLFLTRRSGKRACVQQAEVERSAEAHGFRIVAPEEHALSDQVALVRSAEVIAGFAGSAMFHLALTGRPARALVIASTTYPAANEQQMAAALGHDLTLFTGTSLVPDGARFVERFHADYRLDDATWAAWQRTLDEL